MQLAVTKKSYFLGEEKLLVEDPIKDFRQSSVFCESKRIVSQIANPNFGKSVLSLTLSLDLDGTLRGAKIANREKNFSVRFDESGDMIKDSYPAEYEQEAKVYRQNLKTLLAKYSIEKAKPLPIRHVVHSFAIKDHEDYPKKTRASFSPMQPNVVNIQKSKDGRICVTIPKEVASQMNLVGGMYAELAADIEGINFKTIMSIQHLGKIYETSDGYKAVTVPTKVIEKIWLGDNTRMHWLVEDTGNCIVEPTTDVLSNSVRVQHSHGYPWVIIPTSIVEKANLAGINNAEWT